MATKAPTIFKVGTDEGSDFSPEEIELLTYRIRDWFASPECDRQYDDPLTEAKEVIRQCLLGITKDGKVWNKASKSFAQRIKIKAQYDMDSGKGVPSSRIKSPNAKRYHANKDAIDAANSLVAQPSPMMTGHVQQQQKDMEKDILQAYPELDTPVHRPNVRRLALLYAQQELVSAELASARTAARKGLIETLSTLQKTIESTMKALDIYPDQLRKRMDAQRKGSIGDLVATVEDDVDFKQREKLWALTAALQLWWMTQHPNGKNTGPQIHDFEMWHLTRTRPIRFKCKCGYETVLVEGFTPTELKEYLVANGVLVQKPVIPHIITEDDLNGLNEIGHSEPTTTGEEVSDVANGGRAQDGEAATGGDE